MPHADYPETVLEVLDDHARFRPAALRALRQFARSRPWQGSLEERMEKFRVLNHELAIAYGITEPVLSFENLDGSSSGASHFIPAQNRIVIVGRLSVVTFLHEFAHVRGMNERGACRWSISLFYQFFPRSFSKLIHRGHMLITPETLQRDEVRSGQTKAK